MKAIGNKLERRAGPHLLAKQILDATHPKVPTCQDFGAVLIASQYPSQARQMDRIVFAQRAQGWKWILLKLGGERIVGNLPAWRWRLDHQTTFLSEMMQAHRASPQLASAPARWVHGHQKSGYAEVGVDLCFPGLLLGSELPNCR